MTFDEILDQAIEILQRRGRVTYRTLKRQFALDEEALADLKDELLYSHPQVVDDEGRGLIWTGNTESTSSPSSPALPPFKDRERELLSYTSQYLAEKILTSRSALAGERKQVTVLFADIKDSTELIKDLDPGAAQQLLDPVIHIMMEAVHRFEGTVNQVLGDGIMALFGAPIAHEDHALRACYAALAMQTAMRTYTEEVRRTHGIPLQIRVGLNSGEVVVRTIGNDLHMDYSAVGPITHLAARMEQLATPGSIVPSSTTLRLVEGLIRVNDLGPIPVKGMTDPVEVYELTGASTIRRRIQAAVARGLTKFVGRDTEIESLTHALEKAGAGHGQVVATVGEAGVGKSRLVYEFVHSHRTQKWLVLESASVSYGKATPYFPVIDLLRRYVHVEEGDNPRSIRAKVTGHILTLDDSLRETIPPLLSLLDALPEDNPFLQLDPPQRRRHTLDALKRILLHESQVQPLLLVFEDLHWIDSETQALLDNLMESLPTAQLLLLVNYRPEYQHGWGSKTFYTQLRLDLLQPESADEFLEALLGDDPGLEPLKKLLIERTEGNPFFLEESVRTLIETQVLVGESGASHLAQELPTIQIPPTVQAVLAARIDRLPQEEKQLLQTAAVIGNEVPLSLLKSIAEMPEEVLYRGLTHLQAAEFLSQTSLFPEYVYTFKHALTHEVAYGSILQERRRLLHARIVAALEAFHADRLDDQIEQLAHHAFRGEVWDKAFTYFRQAGMKAVAHSALREAVVCFEQALEALRHLPKDRDTIEQAIDLRFDLQHPLFALGELDRMVAYLRDAESLAQTIDNPSKLAEVSVHTAYYLWLIGDHERAIDIGQRILAQAEALQDMPLQVRTNTMLGRVYVSLGDYQQAVDCFRKNVVYLETEQLREVPRWVITDSILSCTWLGWCCAGLGAFAEGVAYTEKGLRVAEAVKSAYSGVAAHRDIGHVYLWKGDCHKAIPILERGLELCQVREVPALFPIMASLLGYGYSLTGRHAETLPLLEQVLERAASMRLEYARSLWVTLLGEAYLVAGRLADATEQANHALELSRLRKERGHQAYTRRLLGNIAAYRDPADVKQAETHYQQALALATELGMRPLQAHCHCGLGSLYSQTDQPEQACAELFTAIEMYRDMEMTFWLPETEAALAEVEER